MRGHISSELIETGLSTTCGIRLHVENVVLSISPEIHDDFIEWVRGIEIDYDDFFLSIHRFTFRIGDVNVMLNGEDIVFLKKYPVATLHSFGAGFEIVGNDFVSLRDQAGCYEVFQELSAAYRFSFCFPGLELKLLKKHTQHIKKVLFPQS